MKMISGHDIYFRDMSSLLVGRDSCHTVKQNGVFTTTVAPHRQRHFQYHSTASDRRRRLKAACTAFFQVRQALRVIKAFQVDFEVE